ncbi:MAG: shikimate dehydrogenase [Gammaproteobacteria bacterium]|nr:shikimate dehydrogenase [Gammaproteobacteria bacterium]
MHYEFRVIGNPIAHSKSPFIHQEFAKQAGLSVNYERVLASIEFGEFENLVNELKMTGVKGCNITLPFKEQAYIIAQKHSESAKRAKAANTFIFNADGSIYADNTDGIGLVCDIQNNIGYALADKRILICGAGGAVRGILYSIIEQHPLTLSIANRNMEKAYRLANECADLMPIEAVNYQDLAGEEFDVIIDATSFADEPLPLPTSLLLSADSLAYDLKYMQNAATDTLFMAWARTKSAAKVSDGMGMLVEQAAEAFKLWTGFMPKTQPVIELFK